ncbi:hypothetical protein [Microbispora sp. NBRC 16548]|uniref:hypothetical protein n=1 Tax=Microbispora sp. NBRC 16548 TaxID=3030994 RepID=UPI0024A4B99E|nr:hypothetical protein [Microbispora sp. NBRC 16548]GLX07558.1 hypothetical protein Misp03_44840 [Microbispora sp. NBRC 16548]
MSPAKGETHHATAVSPHRQDASARPAPAGSQDTPTDGADAATAPAVPEVGCPTAEGHTVLYAGKTTASYFWDDGSGVNGDTGAPASGEPMQEGLAASPSWPMGTKGYVVYKGKKADFFVGDRGPGVPSSSGVMLDLDGKTFADLTGGTWNTDSLTVEDADGLGHIPVKYVITQWGKGLGKTGAPKPFSTGAYGVKDQPKPPPPCPNTAPAPSASPAAPQDAAPTSTPGVKESPAPVSPVASVAPAPPAVPAPPAAPDTPATQAEAATAQMSPLSGTTGANPAPNPAPKPAANAAGKTTPKTAEETAAKTVAETVKGARTGEVTASPAFTPASAVDGQLEEAAVPAFSVAIVVCALAAVGAKAVLSRPARTHGTSHQQGRHRDG